MKRTTRILSPAVLAAAVLLFASAAHAQTVQGLVVDEGTKQPLGGARLSLLSDSDSAVVHSVADSATGMFYLTAPAPGHYRVQIVVGRGGVVISPEIQLDSNQVIEQTFAVPPLPQAMRDAYLPDDVTTRAKHLPGLQPPRYPDRLRRQNVSGIVRVLFVVDSTGQPDMSTFRVLESSRPEFTDAVRYVVPGWRFTPAERDGHPVAQVQPISVDFDFDPAPSRLRPDERDFGIIIRALPVGRVP